MLARGFPLRSSGGAGEPHCGSGPIACPPISSRTSVIVWAVLVLPVARSKRWNRGVIGVNLEPDDTLHDLIDQRRQQPAWPHLPHPAEWSDRDLRLPGMNSSCGYRRKVMPELRDQRMRQQAGPGKPYSIRAYRGGCSTTRSQPGTELRPHLANHLARSPNAFQLLQYVFPKLTQCTTTTWTAPPLCAGQLMMTFTRKVFQRGRVPCGPRTGLGCCPSGMLLCRLQLAACAVSQFFQPKLKLFKLTHF